MIVGRIAVGIIIFAIVLGNFIIYARLYELLAITLIELAYIIWVMMS